LTDAHTITARLLDREVTDEILRESTAHVAVRKAAVKKNAVEADTKSIVVFRIATEWLALPTGVYQEIAESSAVRTLPNHRRGVLSGLVNVRGELLLCVALGVVLGLNQAIDEQKSANATLAGRLMICRHDDARTAFQVSEVHGLHRYHPRDLRAAPPTLAKAASGMYTLGVIPWNGRTVGCLDDELLFYTLNKGLE
jgi:chemotaxis-related protein WspD